MLELNFEEADGLGLCPRVYLGAKFSTSCWSLVRKKNDNLAVQYEDCPYFAKAKVASPLQIFCVLDLAEAVTWVLVTLGRIFTLIGVICMYVLRL